MPEGGEMKDSIREEEEKREDDQPATDIKKELRRQGRIPWKNTVIRELRRCQQWDMKDWWVYLWTPKLMLDQFHVVSNEFLIAVYSLEKQPLTVRSVPWPVLHSPYDITLEKIAWENVEGFVRYAQFAYGSDIEGHTNLVKQIQKRFLPNQS